jgi:hypothetical protein
MPVDWMEFQQAEKDEPCSLIFSSDARHRTTIQGYLRKKLLLKVAARTRFAYCAFALLLWARPLARRRQRAAGAPCARRASAARASLSPDSGSAVVDPTCCACLQCSPNPADASRSPHLCAPPQVGPSRWSIFTGFRDHGCRLPAPLPLIPHGLLLPLPPPPPRKAGLGWGPVRE